MALDPNFHNSSWQYSSGASNSPWASRDQAMGENLSDRPDWLTSPFLAEQNADYLASRGWTGSTFGQYDSDGGGRTVSPEFVQWAGDNGIVLGKSSKDKQWGNKDSVMWSMFDEATGKPVGNAQRVQDDTTFMQMMGPIMMAAGGPLIGAFGGGVGGAAAAGATLGGIQGGGAALESGGNVLSGALKGAAVGGAAGGLGGAFGTGAGQYDVGGLLGISDPNLIKFANSAAGTLGKSLVTGGNPTSGLLGGAVSAAGGALGLGGINGIAGNIDPKDFTSGAFEPTTYDPNALNTASPGDSTMDWSSLFGNSLDLGPEGGFNLSGEFITPPAFDLSNVGLGGSTYNDLAGNFDWTGGGTGQLDLGAAGGFNGPDLSGFTGGGATDATAGGGVGGVAGIIKSLFGSASGAVGGGSNLAALLGGVAGAASGGKSNTSTTQQLIDPRMAQYVYGSGYGDPNSLLGAAQKQYQANPNGINQTMQQGLDMTKAALTDPAYSQGYQQQRTVGGSLLGGSVAGNPFTTGQGPSMGQGPTMGAGGAGGLLGDADRYKALMSRGRGLLSA